MAKSEMKKNTTPGNPYHPGQNPETQVLTGCIVKSADPSGHRYRKRSMVRRLLGALLWGKTWRTGRRKNPRMFFKRVTPERMGAGNRGGADHTQ